MAQQEMDMKPSCIRKGDMHVDGNTVVWTAESNANRLETGQIQIDVVYPRTMNRDIRGTAEFLKDEPIRILRGVRSF